MGLFKWVADKFHFVFGAGGSGLPNVTPGAVVPDATIKACAESVIAESRFVISDLSLKLQQGAISLDDWYAGMKAATKDLHTANAALARGGWDEMRLRDYARVENIVADQWNGVEGKFPGMRAFAEDVKAGRYGDTLEKNGFLNRAGQYADAGRATYENERVELAKERGHLFGKRILAALDHCPTCLAEGGVVRPIDEIVAIGDSECGARCGCVVVSSSEEGDLSE